MSWIIKVENLSKLYRIGSSTAKTETLYAKLGDSIKGLWSKKPIEDEIDEKILAHSEQRIISPAQIEDAPQGCFWALKDVSFEINEGDRVGILGPNGSGKSTLLKILSRITAPTVGTYRYRGRLISLLEVGTGFHAELSGRDNIYLNAAINGMSKKAIKAKFDEIVEFSELGEQIYTPVKRYSSGMYMRLAFSIAAHLESEILIVDEVLAVGDAGFQRKCKNKMLEVAGQGRTLLFVSHDISAIQNICNKAMQLAHGQLIEQYNNDINESSDLNPVNGVGMVTSKYVQNSYGSQTEIFWTDDETAPKLDDCARLIAVRVLNEQHQVQTEFDVKEPVVIEVEFQVLKAKYALNVHLYVTTVTGERIFVSMDNLDLEDAESIRAVGRYVQRCTIPTPFLDEGVFQVDIFMHTHPVSSHSVGVESVVSFMVTDDKDPRGVIGNWTGDRWRTHTLRPRFHWQIEHTPETEFVTENKHFDVESMSINS